jgi:hypothetical protein
MLINWVIEQFLEWCNELYLCHEFWVDVPKQICAWIHKECDKVNDMSFENKSMARPLGDQGALSWQWGLVYGETMSQPHFWKSVRMTLTLPKWGLGSHRGLPKLQSSIAGSKHLALKHSSCHWKTIEVYMSKMTSHEPFGHLQHKLWQKEGMGVKLAIWPSTTKSRESTRPRCVKMECDTPLERSQWELQVCFRPHLNPRSEQRVMNSQSLKNLNRDNFETPPWEFRDKNPFG